MACDEIIMRYTGYFHILSLIIAMFGTYKQIDAIENNKPHTIWLPLALTFMLLIRIPNQVCLAMNQSYGWLTVFGTLMGVTGFAFLAFVTYKKSKENINKKK